MKYRVNDKETGRLLVMVNAESIDEATQKAQEDHGYDPDTVIVEFESYNPPSTLKWI